MPTPLSPLRTKFIATLGPKSDSPEIISGLMRAGVSVLRSNFAHCPYEEYRERRRIITELNEQLGTKVLMQADIQGTNMRVGELPGGSIHLEEGRTYTFCTLGTELREGEILINDDTLHHDVKAGEPIAFMDGALEGEITHVEGHRLTVQMINSGNLYSRKSINVPETHLTGPIITAKDRRDLEFLIHDAGVDWLALSFIAGRKEIDEVRTMVGDLPIKIMRKIERKIAIDNIQEIIEASDALMIARGDLGIELPMEEIPILQKEILLLAHQAKKPVVTATQMLLSMTNSLRPTRAEVSDVANAVFDRSDALMLSEETAAGAYPVHALETMVKIVRRVEQYVYERPNYFDQYAA